MSSFQSFKDEEILEYDRDRYDNEDVPEPYQDPLDNTDTSIEIENEFGENNGLDLSIASMNGINENETGTAMVNRAKSHFFRTCKYEGSNENRRSFLTKVFCVLFFQFILVAIVVACGVDVETFYEQARARPRTFIWAFGVVTLFLLFLMIFAWRLKASSPLNMVMVVVLTLMASFYFGSVAAVYHDDGRFIMATFIMLIFSHLALGMLAFVGRFKWWRALGVAWIMDALVWGAVNAVAGFDAKYLVSLLFALFFNIYSLFEVNRITVRFGFDAVATSVLDIFIDLINCIVFIFYWIGTSVSSKSGKIEMLPYGYRIDDNNTNNQASSPTDASGSGSGGVAESEMAASPLGAQTR